MFFQKYLDHTTQMQETRQIVYGIIDTSFLSFWETDKKANHFLNLKPLSLFYQSPIGINIPDSEEVYQGYSPFQLQHSGLGKLI